MSSVQPNELARTPPPPERPELPDGGAPTPPRWGPGLAALGFAVGLGLTLAGALVITLVAVAFGADAQRLPSGVNVLLTVAQDGAFVAAAVYVASRVARPAPWQFGLRGLRPGPFVVSVLVALVSFLLLSLLYDAVVHVGKQKELPDQLGADGGTLALVAAAFLVTVIAPVAEELFFRGFVFTALRTWRGTWVAAGLTGLVFGAIHAGSAPDVLDLPILAVFGTVLCLLYARTRSLYPCMVLHALNNCSAFAGTRHGWTWQLVLLFGGALGSIALLALLVRRLAGPAPALVG